MVEILHAQDHLAAGLPRTKPRNQERAHIPEMQGARRAWRQPANISISQHGSFKSPVTFLFESDPYYISSPSEKQTESGLSPSRRMAVSKNAALSTSAAAED
jgi:hypothetical protein